MIRGIRETRRRAGERWGAAIYRRALRDLPNPTLIWHGVTAPDFDQLRLLRVGDCSWLAMEFGHTFGKPGYPAILAEKLRAQGVALRFDDCYAGHSDDVSPELLTKMAPVRPDAIIVQMGVWHGLREVLPIERTGLGVIRLWVNWELGRVGGPLHRHMTAPLLRRFGRPLIDAPVREHVAAGLSRLSAWIDEVHPGVPWAILSPHPVVSSGFADPALVEQAASIYAEVAASLGATILDYRDAVAQAAVGREREVHGVTGSDLRMTGHEPIADMLLQWLSSTRGRRDRVPDSKREPATDLANTEPTRRCDDLVDVGA